MSLNIKTPPVLNATAIGAFGAVSIKAMHEAKTGRYTTVSLGVENPMSPVTPTGIRRIRLGELRSNALRQELLAQNPELTEVPAIKTYFSGKTGRTAAKKTHLEPTDEQLETASAIFRLARLVGDYPIKAVQRSFGLEHPIARLWVNRARTGGHLV